MIKLNVRANFPQVMRELDRLPLEIGNKVLVRSLNGTVAKAKPEMAKQISREFMVTSAQAKDNLSIRNAKAKDGVYRFDAELMASNGGRGRSMNLINFVEKVVSLAQQRKRVRGGEGGTYRLRGREVTKVLQLRFKIKRSGGMKVIPGGFIANDGRTMFIRVGKKRLPIEALSTIAMGQMFNTRRINEVVVQSMLDNFVAQFNREKRTVLGGWGKR